MQGQAAKPLLLASQTLHFGMPCAEKITDGRKKKDMEALFARRNKQYSTRQCFTTECLAIIGVSPGSEKRYGSNIVT